MCQIMNQNCLSDLSAMPYQITKYLGTMSFNCHSWAFLQGEICLETFEVSFRMGVAEHYQFCDSFSTGRRCPDVASLNYVSLEKMGWSVPGMMHHPRDASSQGQIIQGRIVHERKVRAPVKHETGVSLNFVFSYRIFKIVINMLKDRSVSN
jgi:hypothetical protein